MSLKEKIDLNRLPRHVAIIMDGNGRWAKQHGRIRTFGHKNGARSGRETVEAAAELGIEVLTLYAFSTENWNRPRQEIDALMQLLVQTLARETPTLMENRIRLDAIGDLKSLPPKVSKSLLKTMDETRSNDRMRLVLALSYSARWEITQAVRTMATEALKGVLDPANINESDVAAHLSTSSLPDPELMIRTSGEYRISNFLLWQLAYAELYFTPKLWPDFGKEDLYEAIVNYQGRERRFGKVSEQIITQKA